MKEIQSDTHPVRESEQLDWHRLEEYLRPRLYEIFGSEFQPNSRLTVEQFGGGHSNLTYLLRFGDRELVLRRPPFGKLPPKAHDMAREFRILQMLNPVFPLAPRVFHLCEDVDIIGSTFYLMERRRGVVVQNSEPPEISGSPEMRKKISGSLVDTLADLHLVDAEKSGLLSLGKPEGFVERQVRGWTERWRLSQTDELPTMNELAGWLKSNLPPEPERYSFLHGDFKLDNAMLDPDDLGKINAVLDWEMSAPGHPLIDLGILLGYWVYAGQRSKTLRFTTMMDKEGWFERDQIIERYQSQTNFNLDDLRYFEVFAVFKNAVVAQQIFYRFKSGQTDDPRFANFDAAVIELSRLAANLI
ncbi:MAG: phosphotransferase family protein [Pyrinomonadaceae bacterium]